MKFLITGHHGFIGKNLWDCLEDLGHTLVGIDESFFELNNWSKSLREYLVTNKFDGIFHVGACSDTLETDVNYMMTRNYEFTKILVDWCKENARPIIYSSSAANYGTNGQFPSNLYGWSKYVSEDYVISNGGVALRYFNVYGPKEEHKGKMASVAFQMFIKNQKKEPIYLFPGKPKRDFVYVKDIVSANLFAYENYQSIIGKFYEVGSGTASTFEEVLEYMQIDFSYTSQEHIPNGYQFFTESKKELWLPGWKSQWTLELGIKDYKMYLEKFL